MNMEVNNEKRIQALKETFWIGYPRVQEIRKSLESLLIHPKILRMPNIAIIGETNNGKTTLIDNFYNKHKVEPNPTNHKTILPVISLQMPSDPDENRLYDVLLERLFANGSPREPVTSKLTRLKKILTNLEVRIIILDEFQNMLVGALKKQRKLLNAIKYLGNELQISFVASGTMEVLAALNADPQIANRFETMFLPKWTLNEDFLRLLVTMEPRLGLKKKSYLENEALASLILEESEGTIGEIHELLRRLAKYAITTGVEQITVDMFSADNLKKANWRSPTLRNRPG